MFIEYEKVVQKSAVKSGNAMNGCDASPVRQITSASLLGEDSALVIKHQGAFYILRHTRAGKLILTK